MVVILCFFFFFFKQKTAYEITRRDWSSDVCSSDLVDDVWMTCGSDNFNRRSWTHDSEITCAVVDPSQELPRRLRLQLWAEHLQLPLDDPRLLDPVVGFELWRQRAADGEGRARRHEPAPVRAIHRP